MSARPAITFAELTPGRSFGEASFTCTAEIVERWQGIYPELNPPPDSTVAPGLCAVIYMDAYSRLVSPRPEGNVHATQTFRWWRLARVGETLRTAIVVAGAEESQGRRRVTFRSTTNGSDDAPVLEGEMVVLWAR